MASEYSFWDGKDIKTCPCGFIPTGLIIEYGPDDNYAIVSGNCCNGWMVMFDVTGLHIDGDEARYAALKAWNEARRSYTLKGIGPEDI